MSKWINDKNINRAYVEELIAALNGPGVALVGLPGLDHPSWGGGSKKGESDEQEEDSRVGTSEHVVKFGLKVDVVERLRILFY